MKKRIIAVICILVLAVTMMSGCGKQNGKTSDIDVSAPGEFPIVKEKIELTFFAPKPTMMSNISTNTFTKFLEELTGVHINWELAQGDTTQAINLKIASDELPDVFYMCAFSNAQLISYGDQGIFVDLADYVDEHAVNLKEILAKREDVKTAITLDGKIYGLPRVEERPTTLYANKMFVYKPWLDKLGMAEPTTTEEFYQMLKAFKEKDPNGNGKNDEIPMASRGIQSNIGLEMFLMNAFQYTSETRMYIENGKVKFCADTEDYKEGLKYLNKLYSEGLIVSDVFTIDRNGITALGQSNPPTLGAATGMYAGMFCLTSDAQRCDEYTCIAPLKGPKGQQQTPKAKYLTYPGQFCVTSSCKYPEVAVKIADYIYSWDGHMKLSGKDIGLREAKEGELNFAGQQAEFAYDEVKDETPFGVVQNENWGGTTFSPTYWDSDMELKFALKESEKGRPNLNLLTKEKYEPYAKDMSFSETIAMKSSDDEITYNEIYNNIKDEVNKWFADFVMGRKSIDKDWDAYLKRLDELGLKEMLKLCQEAIS